MKSTLFTLITFSLINISCLNQGPNPSTYVGNYEVSFTFDDKIINKEELKKNIDDGMSEAKKAMEDAKKELDSELDLSKIDTTTAEGKIEYLAKNMGKTMSEVGLEMGGLTSEFGNLFGNMASSGIEMSQTLLNNLKVNVELQADGDVKLKDNKLVSMMIGEVKWKIENGKFNVTTSNDNKTYSCDIIDESANLIKLKAENVTINLKKK